MSGREKPDGWFYRTITIWGGRYTSDATFEKKGDALTEAQLALTSGLAQSVTLYRRRAGAEQNCGEIRPRKHWRTHLDLVRA